MHYGLPDRLGNSPDSGDDTSNTQSNQAESTTWATRDEAYEALERLADFLGSIEPHSPTPYLIRRAVSWGKLPLPQLMREIAREGGDLHGMMNLLGLEREDVLPYAGNTKP